MNRRGLAHGALIGPYHIEIREMHMQNWQDNLLPHARSQLLRHSRSLGAMMKLGQCTVGLRTQID